MNKIIYPEIESYLERLSEKEPLLLEKLNEYTRENIHGSHMISGRYQGRILSMISKILNPSLILEIGTYTGYSALCLSEGLSEGGKLISLERNRALQAVHEKFITDNPKVSVVYGDALETIEMIQDKIDLVFIDADKRNYSKYFDMILPKLNKGGIILSDNILWKGRVVEEIQDDDKHAKIIKSILEFNKKLNEDDRVEHIILPIRDGMSVARKL